MLGAIGGQFVVSRTADRDEGTLSPRRARLENEIPITSLGEVEAAMVEMTVLDQVYDFVLSTFIDRGYGPHYTEVAAALGVSPQDGLRVIKELLGQGMAAWFAPDTDYLASFSPFNSQPTQYRVAVDGLQKWFGQCAFESLAICWLFPGQPVTIQAPCLDCGEPLRITVRDGSIETAEPAGICGFTRVPYRDWATNWAYT